MNRKILIITNPGEKNSDNYCGGVYKDAENYISYFQQPYGGYWSDSEIEHIDMPSKTTIQSKLNSLKNEDFSIIVFCGHGWYSSVSESNILELNSNDSIDSMDLRGGDKRIVILDSCRKVYPEYISDSLIKAKYFSESLEGMQLNPQECKRYYNKSIQDAPSQLIMAYAADVNELAGDSTTKGGYYSSSLLKAGRAWVDETLKTADLTKSYYTGRFPSTHDKSIPNVIKLSGDKQHPQIEKPRVSDSKEYLPFAILA